MQVSQVNKWLNDEVITNVHHAHAKRISFGELLQSNSIESNPILSNLM